MTITTLKNKDVVCDISTTQAILFLGGVNMELRFFIQEVYSYYRFVFQMQYNTILI